MKLDPRGFRVLMFATVLAASSWTYGLGRSLAETVGFDLGVSMSSCLVVAIFLALPAAVALVLRVSWSAAGDWLNTGLLVLSLVAVAAGFALSESWLLFDEHRFAVEVEESGADHPYSRARAWPNDNGSLIFAPDKGIWSTD